jgi:hypothetical protein
VERKVAIHPLEVFLICPTETCHPTVFYRRPAVFTELINTVKSGPEVAVIPHNSSYTINLFKDWMLLERNLYADLMRNAEGEGEGSADRLGVQKFVKIVSLVLYNNHEFAVELPACAQCSRCCQTVLVCESEIRPTTRY